MKVTLYRTVVNLFAQKVKTLFAFKYILEDWILHILTGKSPLLVVLCKSYRLITPATLTNLEKKQQKSKRCYYFGRKSP